MHNGNVMTLKGSQKIEELRVNSNAIFSTKQIPIILPIFAKYVVNLGKDPKRRVDCCKYDWLIIEVCAQICNDLWVQAKM